MRLHSVSIRQYNAIQELDLSYDDLGPGLIAIVGSNGAGKTSLLECSSTIPLYRCCPSYGTSFMQQTAQVPKASIVLDFSVGRQRCRSTLTKNGVREQAELVTPHARYGPLLRDHAEGIAALLVSEDLFLLSVFAAQGGVGSLLLLDPVSRREAFLRLLGLDRYDHWMAAADTLAAEHREHLGGVSLYRDGQARAEAGLHALAEREAGRAAAHAKDLEALAAADAAHAAHQSALLAIHETIAIRRSSNRARETERHRLQRVIAEAESQLADRVEAPHWGPAQYQNALAEIATLTASASGQRQALEQIKTLATEHTQALATVEREIRHLDDRTWKAIQGIWDRGTALAADVDLTHPMCRVCVLTTMVRTDIGELGALQADYLLTRERLVTSQHEHTRALRTCQEQLPVLTAALADADSALQAHTAAVRAYERDGEWRSLEAAKAAAQTAIAALPDLEPLPSPVAAEAAVAEAAKVCRELQRQVGGHQATIDADDRQRATLLADLARFTELMATCLSHEREAVAYRKVKDLIGVLRDLALKIACPEVAAFANQLLADFWDGRFQIRFALASRTKAGKDRPTFVPIVVDTANGREATRFSGGEQTVIQEAIRLAIAAVNAKLNGIQLDTIFRDEASSALDAENAAHYLEMLRRFRAQLGVHQVIFVSHLERAWEAADRRVWMDRGQIRRID